MKIVRIEGTPEAGHNRLPPVAGWLRLADRPELPMPVTMPCVASFRPATWQATLRNVRPISPHRRLVDVER